MIARILVLVAVCTSTCFGGDPLPITTIIVEGNNIFPIGTVEFIDNIAINDHGETLIELNTDFSNTDQDSVLIKNQDPFIQEGVVGQIDGPMGAFVDSFDSVTINNSGVGGFNFFIDPLPGSEDSGLYIDNILLIQESAISTSKAFTEGTPFIGFFDAKINDPGNLMVVASIDDPAISSSVDRAIMIVNEDEQTVIAKEGDILPGQTEVVDDFGTGPHESAFNNNNQVMYLAELSGDSSSDVAIYIDQTLIAQEGSPSPAAGEDYEILDGRSLDLNDHGEFVFKANLSGNSLTDDVIVKNKSIFKREGDPAPGGFSFTGFGSSSSPVKIGNSGDVLWFGEWDDPNTDQNSGLFLNDSLIVQEGVTVIDGLVVDSIATFADQFSMSSSGQWIIFEATLAGGINGAFATMVESVLLGDVNCDGEVNLLDVQPFVDLITGGGFSEKADINGDGTVDILDVSPFVALLTGP